MLFRSDAGVRRLQAYGDWLGAAPPTEGMLLKYAIGGAATPAGQGTRPQVSRDTGSGDFVFTVIVREDAAIAVVGKTASDLASGGWTAEGVTAVEPADQSAAPAGCKVVEYRVTAASAQRFLRLEVTHSP